MKLTKLVITKNHQGKISVMTNCSTKELKKKIFAIIIFFVMAFALRTLPFVEMNFSSCFHFYVFSLLSFLFQFNLSLTFFLQ